MLALCVYGKIAKIRIAFFLCFWYKYIITVIAVAVANENQIKER